MNEFSKKSLVQFDENTIEEYEGIEEYKIKHLFVRYFV